MDEPWPLGILFLALTLGVPGVMICILWARRPLVDGTGDTSDALAAERLGVALPVPTPLLGLACELLARVGLLDTVTVWIYAGAATVTAFAVLVAKRDTVRSWRSAYDFRATLWGLPAALIVVGAAAVQVRMVLLRMDSLQ